jgi:CRISPR-associated protein Cmr5
MRTQSQRYLETAARRVTEAQALGLEKIYGGLCHTFPVLVRTAGLAQAIAFHESKAGSESDVGGDRQKAHKRLLDDYKDLLPEFDIGKAELGDYMRATRRVLGAWVFYKRFAVSILRVKPGDDRDQQGGSDA